VRTVEKLEDGGSKINKDTEEVKMQKEKKLTGILRSKHLSAAKTLGILNCDDNFVVALLSCMHSVCKA